ncbi:MAG: hypothetical protein IT270_19095 [Saprospiraceae bacterium]|nr:hypothetical protein [Saprospiraceae bacterium]
MKNLSTILFFACILLLISCKKEEEKSIITYEIGREIAQSVSMMQMCIHESDRIVAEEYDDCPIAVEVFPMPASNGNRYVANYGEGCTLPNGMEMHGTFTVAEFHNDPYTGLRRRLITTDYFVADTLRLNGILTMMEQSPGHWNVYFWSDLMYGSSGKIRLYGYPKAQLTSGLETVTTTDDQWSISVDSLFVDDYFDVQTYAFTEPGNALQSSSLCAWTNAGILNINNGDALLQFGNGACDDHFWLDWSSGASVQINF